MKPTKTFLILLFIVVTSFSCSSDATTSKNETIIHEASEIMNVAYGDHELQTYDLYLPAHRDNETKTLILVHGGAWTSGDKSDMNGLIPLIQNDLPDIAILNMNYRLVDGSTEPYPMQINDITAVINHVNSRLENYHISDDFGLLGTSAGAHLSLLWSYAFNSQNQVKMVCSIVGPTNFTDPAYLENVNFDVLNVLENLYGLELTTDFLEEISPYHRLTETAPPTILFYGGKDQLVPVSQGLLLQEKLQDLGVMHEYNLYPEASHGWDGLELLDTRTKLTDFIYQHLD